MSKTKKCRYETLDGFDRDATPLEVADQGVQGDVYKCMWKDEAAIMKTSKFIDFVLELEEEAWLKLKDMNCLHFCEVFEKISLKPGEKRYCLFSKEIRNNQRNDTLANLIYEANHHPTAILNCVRQTLAAIVMFEHLGITHYDLHADNAMIADTPYDVHVYKFGDRVIPIRTFGLTSVIIDFGMAYIPNTNYKAPCFFTKHGFTTFMDDPLIDSRLLLMTTIKDMKGLVSSFRSKTRSVFNTQYKESCNTIDKFNKKVETVFAPLNLEDNGWFKDDRHKTPTTEEEYINEKSMFPDIIKEVLLQIPPSLQTTKGIFKRSNFEWVVELLQYEVTIPVTHRSNSIPFQKALLLFAINWKKFVEPVIRNTREEYFFVKDLVVLPNNTDRSPAQREMYTTMRHRYPMVKNIMRLKQDIQKMGDAFNNILYNKIKEFKNIKNNLYRNVPFKTTKDLLINLPSMPNRYISGMKILIMDPTCQTHKEVVIDDELANALNTNEQEALHNYVV